MARLFVGVALDPAVTERAAAAADALRAELGASDIRIQARWIPRENLHITLFFIGEIAPDRVDRVKEALSPALASQAFELELAGLGAFPPSGVPRVFWIGIARGGDPLAALHREVSDRLSAAGCGREARPYSAHLTIARVKDLPLRGQASRVRRVLAGTPVRAGVSRVSAVTLFESRLSPKGSTYEPLLRVPLR
ncbi:MAG TPA: RNA 2',3'-cyclic phosphodiesterase [Vicinamibacterales bacterium]